MSILAGASMIFYAALHTGQPCDKVFADSILEIKQSQTSDEEKVQLNRFAKAACKTSNPDIFWQIAKQESSFRFDIVRINKKNRVLEGKSAIKYLKSLKSSQKPVNVDIGMMQINWYWHRQEFNHDPLKMLDAAEQVKYVESIMAPMMVQRCTADRWVGCYHHPSNKRRAEAYQQMVKKSAKLLTFTLLRYMKKTLKEIPVTTRKLLPQLKKSDFYLAYRNLVRMQVPNDSREADIKEKKMKTSEEELIILQSQKLLSSNT